MNLPEPFFVITLTRGTAWSRRAAANAIRCLAWGLPAFVLEALFLRTGHHSREMALAAAYLAIMLAVLLVNVRTAGGENRPATP
jgi:hypothetical protein